jgi:hypothetical protein
VSVRALPELEIVGVGSPDGSLSGASHYFVVSREIPGDPATDRPLYRCETYPEAKRAKRVLELVPSIASDVQGA